MIWGSIIGIIKGDTRTLDYSSYVQNHSYSSLDPLGTFNWGYGAAGCRSSDSIPTEVVGGSRYTAQQSWETPRKVAPAQRKVPFNTPCRRLST